MEFWSTTMQDDTYLVVDAGWYTAAKPVRLDSKTKDRVDFTIGKDRFKSELIPAELLIARFFAAEQAAAQDAEASIAAAAQALDEMYEEHGGDDGVLSDLFGEKTRIARKDAAAKLKEKGLDPDEKTALTAYLKALDAEGTAKEKLKAAEEALNTKVAAKYGKLTTEEIQILVVDDKWLHQVAAATDTELQRLSSTLAGRLKDLATRYDQTLPALAAAALAKTHAIENHLKKMRLTW
jgi:type I restriction enzyme M protein